MSDHLRMLEALCGPNGPITQAGLMLALLMAGLLGSLVHCGPMCGPFVLAQVSRNLQQIGRNQLCERHRLTEGLLLPYHLGRLTTYAALGAIASVSVSAFAQIPALRWLPSVLLMLGALLLIGQAAQRISPNAWRVMARLIRFQPPGAGLVRHLAGGLNRNSRRDGYLLGLVLGFLPCGLLYAALALVAASGTALQGALGMLAFGVGTMPSLILVGLGGQALGRKWSGLMAQAGPALLLFNASLVVLLAWQRLPQ